jgi:uncharacterized phiE125 gp8 family phage protein
MDSGDYVVDTKSEFRPGIVIDVDDDIEWPTEELANVHPIEIEFTCGYGATGTTIPELLRQAMHLHITNRYVNRTPDPDTEKAVENAINNLIGNYRVWGM